MVYSNKFVVCVLVNGVVQNELANGTITLPFGTEYCLRFRNKNNRRAVVKFSIDGENVSGDGYLINANSHIDIKRHHHKDAAFKLVPLDSPEAIDAGKNGPNYDKQKGVIEASFYLEKEKEPKPIHHYHHYHHYLPREKRYDPFPSPYCGGTYTTSTNSEVEKGFSFSSLCSTHNTSSVIGSSFNEKLQDGATVEGSMTGQHFHTVYVDLEDTCTVLKLFLQGYVSEVVATLPYQQPVQNLPSQDEDKLVAEIEALKKKKELLQKKADLEKELAELESNLKK